MKALYKKKNDFFDFSDFDKAQKAIVKTWHEFRKQLAEGQFGYKDIEEAKQKSTYLRVLENLLVEADGLSYFSEKIADHNNNAVELIRGTILGAYEVPTFSRFIPNEQYITKHNRFSPPRVEWLYIALGNKSQIEENNLTIAKNCSIKECGCKPGDRYGAYRFDFDSKYNDLKIVNLTIAAERSYAELNSELEKSIQELRKKQFLTAHACKQEVEHFMLKWSTYTYAKLLSEEIFIPVECDNKEYEYVPFQTVAQYFISLGFSGIIYSSAVYPKGKNIVLFDKNYAKPCDDFFEMIIE